MAEKTYTGEVVEENGELMLTFPPAMMEELGWNEGDTIVWDMDSQGRFLLVRKAKPEEK